MEKLTEKHPQETAYILRITKMHSEGKVKEACAYYKEDTEGQPDLETAITALEKLLDILTEGAYTLVDSMREHSDTEGSEIGKYIADKYFQELNDVINELQDYKLGRYYERIVTDENGKPYESFTPPRGIPKISTIGTRINETVVDLLYKLGNNRPGNHEIMTEMMKDMPSPISSLDLTENDD